MNGADLKATLKSGGRIFGTPTYAYLLDPQAG